ncbi:MAG: T9SS type A sorting domain-containing protein [Bacteroidaceae bacterium]
MKKLLLGAAACMLTLSAMNAQTVKDPATYPEVEGYQITNLWAQCSKLGNKPAEIIGANNRGMTVYKGKIYVTNRVSDIGSLLVYDATTGAFEKKINLPDSIAKASWACNDIQVDDAGHLLIANMATDLAKGRFLVYSYNLDDGTYSKVLEYSCADNPSWRIDAFGVYGDITKDGFLMAAIAKGPTVGGDFVLRWNFEKGVYKPFNNVELGVIGAKYIQIKAYCPAQKPIEGNSDGPRVTPIDSEYFYLDGQASYATMYDMDGNIVESFLDPSFADFRPAQPGNNGVDEFSYGGDNFVVYVCANTAVKEYPQAWNICKLGTGQTFAGMKKIARIPEGGLGSESNAVRTALPRIEIKADGAYIYVFATNGGMAAYKMEKVAGAGVESSVADNFFIVARDGKIVLSENADVEVYSIAGQKISTAANAMEMNAPANKGIYLVKAILANGTQKVQKIVVE